MITYNVGFINTDGDKDETQLDIEEHNSTDEEVIELMNLILSLKGELDIKEVVYIEYLDMNIRKLCYELYKIDWKHSHMITKEREMDSIKDYYEGLIDNDSEYTYEDYIEEFGYGGELYVCFEEFCDTEYYDIDYMCDLLDNKKLIDIYYECVLNHFERM